MIVPAPLYLLKAPETCWKCGASIEVFAMLSTRAEKFCDEDGICIFSNLSDLQPRLLEYLKTQSKSFQLRYSATMDDSYYANTCESCESLIGDYFLHSEPDSALFPTNEEEAAIVQITEIPIEPPIEFEATLNFGDSCDLIWSHGKHIGF